MAGLKDQTEKNNIFEQNFSQSEPTEKDKETVAQLGHEEKQFSVNDAQSIEEIDTAAEAKNLLNTKIPNQDKPNSEPFPVLPCLPTSSKVTSSGGSGWGSWAASLLTNALQLDEDDDDPTSVPVSSDGRSEVVSAQPEVNLPKEQMKIERGNTKEEENDDSDDKDEDGGGYGDYLTGLSGWGAGWVTGALEQAKQQSAVAADFLKRDLNEFANVVKKDTSDLANTTTRTLQTTLNVSDESMGKFKGDVSSFLGTVKSTLYTTTAQFYEDEERVSSGSGTGQRRTTENTLEAKLDSLSKDPKTYTTNPTETEAFEAFCATFKVDSMKNEISSLLISHSDVRILYSRLVPSQVSHMDFWSRLWFKRQALESEAERKTELLSKVQTSLHGDLEDWGDDDEEDYEEGQGEDDGEENKTQNSEVSESASKGQHNETLSETDDIEANIRKANADPDTSVIVSAGEDTTTGPDGDEDGNVELTVHIDNEEDSDKMETPPDSSTSDEWEKDFEDCRS